jgi:hypothetical protein
VDFVLDFGNARVKWFEPRNNCYGDCRHAIVALNDGQWSSVVGRGKPPEGLVKVNGSPFAIGDAARRYVIPEKPRGASRYQSDYYGVALAYALAHGIKRNAKNITLFASHAPIDVKYARNLTAAAKGHWTVETSEGTFDFDVKDVQTFDEPLGGYTHFAFTEKGEERKKNPLTSVTTLVIDVGGYTVDVAAVDPGGEIDLLSLKSTRTGVIALTEGFEQELRSNNSTLFQDTGDIDIRKIEGAILSGKFQFGKVAIDCNRESKSAINGLVNDVIQVINAAGGVANYEIMLLTGGGAALIHKTLVDALPRAQFLLAEQDTALMKYANVFGGAKIAALLRNLGEL